MDRAATVGFPGPPPGVVIPIANTLPSLLYTTQLTVVRDSVDYTFDGFPQTLQVVAEAKVLANLSTSDLSFLSNGVCAPIFQVLVLNNLQLTSLSGLVAYFYISFPQLIVSGNPLLLQPGLQPLGPALQCNGPTSPLTLDNVEVEHSDCPNNVNNPLGTVDQVCAYLYDQCGIPSKRSSTP